MDTANYLFKMILTQDFYTGHNRTISYIPQLLPLLALKLNLSLKAVIISYSAGFILFYYAIFNILIYLFKNPRAGLFLALALGLSLRYKFYGPVGEVVLTIPYLALLLGWLTRPEEVFSKLPLAADIAIGCLLALLLLTGHPFITVVTMISLGFHLAFHSRWKSLRFWACSIFTGLILLNKFALGERNTYEAERADRLNNSWDILSNYQDYPIYEILINYFNTQYTFPFTVFICCLVWLVFQKRWFTTLVLSMGFVIVLSIVFIMHAYLGSSILIMLDGYLAHLGVIWALPLAFVWGKEKRPWMVLIIICLLLFNVDRIRISKEFFQQRLAYINTAIVDHTSKNQPKAIASMAEFDFQKGWIGWAIAFETLMLSSLESPDSSRTIYLQEKAGKFDSQLNDKDLFLSASWAPLHIKDDELPKRYFNLKKVPYKEVKLE